MLTVGHFFRAPPFSPLFRFSAPPFSCNSDRNVRPRGPCPLRKRGFRFRPGRCFRCRSCRFRCLQCLCPLWRSRALALPVRVCPITLILSGALARPVSGSPGRFRSQLPSVVWPAVVARAAFRSGGGALLVRTVWGAFPSPVRRRSCDMAELGPRRTGPRCEQEHSHFAHRAIPARGRARAQALSGNQGIDHCPAAGSRTRLGDGSPSDSVYIRALFTPSKT
jgi:hypothetical protein